VLAKSEKINLKDFLLIIIFLQSYNNAAIVAP